MKKMLPLIMVAVVLISALTGCGEKAEISKINTPVEENNAVIQSTENVKNEENQPLVIYHINGDEVELHFTLDKLASKD